MKAAQHLSYPLLASITKWAGVSALVLLATTNLLMVAVEIGLILAGSDGVDWNTYVAATDRYHTGELYAPAEWWYGWRYSPVAVLPLTLLVLIGEGAWRLLHLAAAFALPGRLRILVLVSYPFWFDVHAGNLMIFVAVLAFWAVQGKGWAIVGTFILAILVPRPLMVPLVVWLLWKGPTWRLPFVGLFVVHLIAVTATGYADEWIARLLSLTGEEVAQEVNVAPSAIFGLAWMVMAIPLCVWAFRAGRPALSGLLLQPYWLPYYLLVLVADRVPPRSWWIRNLTPFGHRAPSTPLAVQRATEPG